LLQAERIETLAGIAQRAADDKTIKQAQGNKGKGIYVFLIGATINRKSSFLSV
jgi:hypothetical protein